MCKVNENKKGEYKIAIGINYQVKGEKLLKMTMISQTEAIQFLQDIFKISSIPEKLTNNKAALLDEIVNHYQQKIPFQTITVISRSDEDQHISTLDDIKTQILSTQGGLCYDHSVFMKHLLEALGFQVSLIACDIQMDGLHSHMSVLVQNLIKPGDKYHVDIGSGDPLFKAIPLDFERESPVYKCGFQVYKFTKEGEEWCWWQKVSKSYSTLPLRQQDMVIDGWKKYMTFTLEPRVVEYFKNHMIKHFVTQNPPMSGATMLKLMRAVAYPNHRLLAILATSLLRENDEGEIEKTKITSKEELAGLYTKYFPKIPADKVLIAIDKMEYIFGK
ncbi:arylamine N-acetyltransferase 1-like [Amphiura filiformis]|uniref:arylamine N-acetyltransferase 1-like n=1 Tax=Amphiura filiformis TaxID=82378 RepID=UPI003B215C3B